MTTPSDPLEGPLLTGDTPMSLTWLNSVAEEERRLIFQRCRLIFGIGFVVSALLIGISRMFIHGAVLEPYERIEAFMDGALIVTFAIALLSIHVGHPSARRLMRTAFTVTAVTIILVVLSMAPIQSDFSMELVLALVLFIPAAVIPWQVPYQVVLGALAALGPAIVRGWSYVLLPEARVFWHEALGGSAAFWSDLAVTTVGLMLLAATSIVVTYTLYRLRRKASKLQRLGSYVVEREIGKGGMGRIYVARHTRMLRPSVVKVMHPEMGFDEQSLKRFEREVQVSSSLTHPNTIRIYDYGRAGDGTFYYAMEFLDGLDLKKLVDRFGPIEWPRVVFVLTQICGSLGEAHDRGFIHRDLKPANVFLTQRGGLYDFVKVLDFGLARPMDRRGDAGVTQEGEVLGTPEFMPPETLDAPDLADARSDIYSLGAVAFNLLTGQPPFSGGSVIQVLLRQRDEAARPPSTVCEVEIPQALDDIVLRCLEKRPEDRIQTTRDLADMLDAVHGAGAWTQKEARDWWQLHIEVSPQSLTENPS